MMMGVEEEAVGMCSWLKAIMDELGEVVELEVRVYVVV